MSLQLCSTSTRAYSGKQEWKIINGLYSHPCQLLVGGVFNGMRRVLLLLLGAIDYSLRVHSWSELKEGLNKVKFVVQLAAVTVSEVL